MALLLALLASGCAGLTGSSNKNLCEDPCDEELCNSVSCDAEEGCVYVALNAGPCDDGSLCTTADSCAEGSCVGTAVVCDDKDPCSSSSCNAAAGCVTSPRAGSCDDDEPCTVNESCSGGKCVGQPLSCDDKKVCTTDSCKAGTGCEHVNNTLPCDDGDSCIEDEACQSGACAGGTPVVCDDGNVCTNDKCAKKQGCLVDGNNEFCDDGSVCTTGDTCSGGICLAGQAADCNDNNICTTDSCEPKGGCLHDAADAPCDDGDACTEKGKCKFGACQGSQPVVCDDKNPCTVDACDAEKGCVKTFNTLACDDEDPCTAVSECEDGKCAGFGMVNCDDGNMCSNDSCKPGTGCVYSDASGDCDDGDACTVGEGCFDGLCSSPPPTNCTTCGNGVINVGSGKGAPACSDPNKLTVVKDMKGLKAWLAKPVTSLQIDGVYAFAGADLNLQTSCDVTLSAGAKLDGMGHAVLSAKVLVLAGTLYANGQVWLSASDSLKQEITGVIKGPAKALVVEAKSVAMLGDSDWSDRLCVEGGTVLLGKPGSPTSTLHQGNGKVDLRSMGWLDLHAAIKAKGAVHLLAAGDLSVGAMGSIDTTGAVDLQCGGAMTSHGKVSGGAAVSFKAPGNLTIAEDGPVTAGAKATATAGKKLKVFAPMNADGAITLISGVGLDLGAKAKIATKADLTLNAKGPLLLEGSLSKAGQLLMEAVVLEMVAGASISGTGAMDLLLPGPGKTIIGGSIDNDGAFVLKGGLVHVTQNGTITGNKSVSILAGERLDVDGKITKNQGVYIKATQYYLTDGQGLYGNDSCAIEGSMLAGSAKPIGCAQL